MFKRLDGYFRALDNGTLDEYHDKQDKKKKNKEKKIDEFWRWRSTTWNVVGEMERTKICYRRILKDEYIKQIYNI